jgi:creatinine amidohydrolase
VTDDTGVGDPSAAAESKGARFFEAVVERVAGFLRELDGVNPEALYQ